MRQRRLHWLGFILRASQTTKSSKNNTLAMGLSDNLLMTTPLHTFLQGLTAVKLDKSTCRLVEERPNWRHRTEFICLFIIYLFLSPVHILFTLFVNKISVEPAIIIVFIIFSTQLPQQLLPMTSNDSPVFDPLPPPILGHYRYQQTETDTTDTVSWHERFIYFMINSHTYYY